MKWGIMATGSIAQKFASTVNRMTDEGEILQAVASRTKESAENFARQHRIPEVFDSYKAMAESDSVDVIYIATPNNMHYENVKMCLLQENTFFAKSRLQPVRHRRRNSMRWQRKKVCF